MDTMPDTDPMKNPPHPPLAGLDPVDLLRQGMAEDTFIDGTPTSFNPPPLEVVFYQMLTGGLPGKDLQAPSRKVQIDVRLDEIVLKAMEKDPELRSEEEDGVWRAAGYFIR